jgi:hypothetical protein
MPKAEFRMSDESGMLARKVWFDCRNFASQFGFDFLDGWQCSSLWCRTTASFPFQSIVSMAVS